MMPEYFIGTSGWHYAHWKGKFYPDALDKKDWLGYYAGQFNSVEINSSFYHLPAESTFTSWHGSVPAGFCFAVKASRFITHIKRLQDCREPLNTFLLRALNLKEKLGPLLYQLPAGMHRDDSRLEGFLHLLDSRYHHVFEFRHQSWMDEAVFEILRKYHIGFCIFDMPGLSSPLITTTGFAYIRFHGHESLYSSRYPESRLREWAEKIRGLASSVHSVYIFFNNDASSYAVENALTLRKFLTGE